MRGIFDREADAHDKSTAYFHSFEHSYKYTILDRGLLSYVLPQYLLRHKQLVGGARLNYPRF